MPNRFIIGLGSNIQAETNIKKALDLLDLEFSLERYSPLKQTKAIGPKQEKDFINCAVLFYSDQTSEQIKQTLKSIETKLGRIKTDNKFAPRTIDLDILCINQDIIDPDIKSRYFLQESILHLVPEFKQALETWQNIKE